MLTACPAARREAAWRQAPAAAVRNIFLREVFMPVIKAADLAYGRLRSPDLDKQEEFLTAFGMVRAERTPTALYMRGPAPPHPLHATELGEPKYIGIAVHAASLDDLEKLAKTPGASAVES